MIKKYIFIIYIGFLNSELSSSSKKGEKGVGFALTADGHYHLKSKRLTNVSAPVYYEFQNGLEPSIDVAGVSDLVDEKEPSKEEKINMLKKSRC